MDVVVVTETNLQGFHTKAAFRYKITATQAVSPHKGGVAMLVREGVNFRMEDTACHGPNVVSAVLVSGFRRWLVVGCYLSPTDDPTDTLAWVDAACSRINIPRILLGDFNFRVSGLTPRDDAINASLEAWGFHSSLQDHFMVRRLFSHKRTWMSHGGRYSATCDYIFFSGNRRDWKSFKLHKPRGFTSDHLMLMGLLSAACTKKHVKYCRVRSKLPFWSNERMKVELLDEAWTNVVALRDKGKQPKGEKRKEYLSWIQPPTWKLMDRRAAIAAALETCPRMEARKRKDWIEEKARLARRIRRCLKIDRKRRAFEVGEAAGKMLEGGKVKEAWQSIKHWYKDAKGMYLTPTNENLLGATEEKKLLLANQDSTLPELNLLGPTRPAKVNDEIPSMQEIDGAVDRLRNGCSPGPSGVRNDDLKRWKKHIIHLRRW